MVFKSLFFELVFLSISFWYFPRLLWRSLFSKNTAISTKTETDSKTKIKKIRGKYPKINFAKIEIFNSEVAYALGSRIPKKIMLSSKMISQLKENELEYVFLHEQGHIEKAYLLKEGLSVILLSLLGLSLVATFQTGFFETVTLSFLLSLVKLKITRGLEDEAEVFTLNNLKDPQNMIKATKRLCRVNAQGKEDWRFLKSLFSPSHSYSYRIKVAKSFLKIKGS